MGQKNYVWIHTKIHETPEVFQIAEATGYSMENVTYHLLVIASWFADNGKYGVMKMKPELIDRRVKIAGFARAMIDAGFLESHDGNCILKKYTLVSAHRKALGKKLRNKILSIGVCASCGTGGKLVLDHIVPVSRGGGSEFENLQALCIPCNTAKGTKTMVEFLASRRTGGQE